MLSQVDRDFNAIFSTLLPNTAARLTPPEGGTFLDGLEVRVAFGGVWKESLTELSGGQRSLLALSLVLALCRWVVCRGEVQGAVCGACAGAGAVLLLRQPMFDLKHGVIDVSGKLCLAASIGRQFAQQL